MTKIAVIVGTTRPGGREVRGAWCREVAEWVATALPGSSKRSEKGL